MKNLVLLVSIIYSVNCFSQDPNPDLFQTWYLRFVQSNDMADPYTVSEIQPQITPTLTISNNLDIGGQGACNTFGGSFTNVTSDFWGTSQFSPSTTNCNILIHDSFESNYFSFLQSAGWYQIVPEGNGLVLTMSNPIFGQAIFQNFPLASTEFGIEPISIYPNPSSSVVFFNYNQLMVSKIQVINSLGQNVATINDDFEAVNISDLPSGIYIFRIDTELGTISKKIIKE